MDASEIKEFISKIDKTISLYESNALEIEYLEGLYNDLTHECSLGRKRGVVDGYKMYERMRNTLQRRYELRDQNKYIEPMYDYLVKRKTLRAELHSVMSKMNNVQKNLDNRMYRPKSMDASEMTLTNLYDSQFVNKSPL